MADIKDTKLDVNEKNGALATSDIESSITGTRSPLEDDDLPDPDAGKSDEERAKLVRRHQLLLYFSIR